MNNITKICIIIITVLAISGAVVYFLKDAERKRINKSQSEFIELQTKMITDGQQREKIAAAYQDTAKDFDIKIVQKLWKEKGLSK